MMVINNSKTNKIVKFKRKDKNVYNFAPGEGQIPTNWIRQRQTLEMDRKIFEL